MHMQGNKIPYVQVVVPKVFHFRTLILHCQKTHHVLWNRANAVYVRVLSKGREHATFRSWVHRTLRMFRHKVCVYVA